MAEHGTVEYATATGNDLPAHEATYSGFVHFATVGTVHVIDLVFGLATGGVMGHWFTALVIFIIAIVGCIVGLASKTLTSSYVSFALCFAIFAFTALSSH